MIAENLWTKFKTKKYDTNFDKIYFVNTAGNGQKSNNFENKKLGCFNFGLISR